MHQHMVGHPAHGIVGLVKMVDGKAALASWMPCSGVNGLVSRMTCSGLKGLDSVAVTLPITGTSVGAKGLNSVRSVPAGGAEGGETESLFKIG